MKFFAFLLLLVPTVAFAQSYPTTPPPAAARAGYTTLVYYLDGTDPANAVLSNWLDCTDTGIPPAVWMAYGGLCDTKHFNQEVDPVTGKLAIHYHAYAADNGANTRIRTATSTGTEIFMDFPAGHYQEIQVRYTPVIPRTTTGGGPGPSLFTWADDCAHAANCPASNLVVAPIELDIVELNTGKFIDQAVHDWSVGGQGDFTYSQNQVAHLLYGPPPYSLDQVHTYGALTTTDGVSQMQTCGYADGRFVPTIPAQGNHQNCFRWNFAAGKSPSGVDETHHIVQRQFDIMWFGGNGGATLGETDEYIDHVAVWSCPQWRTDPTCNVNGMRQ